MQRAHVAGHRAKPPLAASETTPRPGGTWFAIGRRVQSDCAFAAGQHVIARGRGWTVLTAETFADCTAVSLREGGGADAGVARTLLVPFDRVRPVRHAPRLRVVRPRRWLHAVRRAGCGARPFGGLSAAIDTSIELLAYQLEPALAVVRDGAARVLIADGVGLGKTIQAGLLLAELAARAGGIRALVLTPAGLRAQWSGELTGHFRLDTTTADSAWLARSARELPPDINPWVLPRIYVASYDFVKRPEVLRALEDLTWDVVVVDEAHNATQGSARLTAIHAVALRARHVVLLTATPHSGNAPDFEALCGLGTTDVRGDPILLFRRSRQKIAGHRRRSAMLAVRPTHAERRMHRLLEKYSAAVCREAAARGDAQARLAVIVLRKRALSSAGSLALSVRRRMDLLSGTSIAPATQLALPLADDEPLHDELPDTAIGSPGLADGTRERRLLEQVLHAAQEAARAESKIARLRRFIVRAREPVIVFTEYRDTLARLRQALQAVGVDAAVLHGGQGAPERDGVQRQFNEGGAVLLATDAAAEGLNLHARCRTVVHFELPWSPGRLQQRAGRVDRIGQRRAVHEIALVAADTAERLVLVPLVRRLARAQHDLDDRVTATPLLTESQVAGAVLEGPGKEMPGGEPTPPDVYVPAGTALSAASAAEVERLTVTRTWRSSRPAPERRRHRLAIPVTSLRRRPNIAAGSVAIHAVTLTSAGGHVVHSALTCVHGPATVAVDRELAALISGELNDIAAAHRRLCHAIAARERTLLARFVSASRQLVQAGLFDARNLREQARHVEADARSQAEIERRLLRLADPTLTASTELVAILHVGGRARR